jgi:regulator of replication initiation timing
MDGSIEALEAICDQLADRNEIIQLEKESLIAENKTLSEENVELRRQLISMRAA